MSEVKQMYTGCLAEAAYFLYSEGEAVVIDPLRETAQYEALAAHHNVKIRYVLETHFHADFCSGHVDLAKKTGATIVFGPTAQPGFEAHIATDGEVLRFGKATLTVLHTPGHTMESVCYLLQDDGAEKPKAVFTGDTLFIGDVGRPDLAAGVSADLTAEKLAGHMYDSLRSKLMPLPDEITVYPAHGAGSACGKNLSTQTWDTLGNQKKTNYALKPDVDRDLFIQDLIAGQPPAPGYFIKNVLVNKNGPGDTNIDEVITKGHCPLSVAEFKAAMASDKKPILMDTRPAVQQVQDGTIDGFIYCSTEDGSFAPWFATAFPEITRPVLLLCESEERVTEAQTRLARVGYDNVIGFLDNGIEAWKQAGEPVIHRQMKEAEEVAALITANSEGVQLVDCRRPTEWVVENVKTSVNYPMDPQGFETALGNLDPSKPTFVMCRSGYRGMIFATALKHVYGYKGDIFNIAGGHLALKQAQGMDVEVGMCPRKAAALLAERQAAAKKKLEGEAQ